MGKGSMAKTNSQGMGKGYPKVWARDIHRYVQGTSKGMGKGHPKVWARDIQKYGQG